MSTRLKRFCRKQGCNQLVESGYCNKHKLEEHQRYDRYRGSSSERGYNSQWRKARAIYLAEHPLCVDCEAVGVLTPATDVDHVIPHKGDMELFWNRDNWAARCHSCHSLKTVREDGGFGR